MKKPGFTFITPVLWVHDMPTSLDYYEQLLGFEILWTWSEEQAFEEPAHPTFCCVKRGEYSLFLCEQGQGNPGTWICLNVNTGAELEQLYSEYQESGAKIVQPPTDEPWGMREMIVQDPDGNTFRMSCHVGA